MALPIYPDRSVLPGLGFGTKWAPMFVNMPTAVASNGAEIDLGLAQYPLHDFELKYNFLHDWSGRSASESLEFKTMIGFFLQIGGTVGRFLFKNPDDNTVFQQLIGTGDGTNRVFQLIRTFGANGYQASEPVGVVDLTSPFNVYLNGSGTPVNPSLYTVQTTSPLLQTITFTTAPPNGQAVAVDMTYWYYCKLGDNNAQFEKFMDRLWMLNKITLRSCRPGA